MNRELREEWEYVLKELELEHAKAVARRDRAADKVEELEGKLLTIREALRLISGTVTP